MSHMVTQICRVARNQLFGQKLGKLAAPAMHTTEPLDFEHVFEGLFLRGLRSQLSDELKAALKAQGLDLSQRLRPAYPAPVLRGCIRAAAKLLYPEMPHGEGICQIGRAFFRGYVDTFIGRATLAVLRLIGPRRTLERMQRNFRTGNNYIETRFTTLAPQHVELWFNVTGDLALYCQGILEHGAELIGAKNTRVVQRPDVSGAGTLLDVQWDA